MRSSAPIRSIYRLRRERREGAPEERREQPVHGADVEACASRERRDRDLAFGGHERLEKVERPVDGLNGPARPLRSDGRVFHRVEPPIYLVEAYPRTA